MNKIYVVYYSGSGNTKTMAEFIGKGIEDSSVKAEVVDVSELTPDVLKDEKVFALGCPSMGDEVLEDEMEDFVAAVEVFSSGKKIALFGSYGWGDGQWMRDWQERMTTAGATILNEEGLITQDSPDEEAKQKCINLGKMLAKEMGK